ncbi:MAG: formimidoylglutamate deiminase [Ornithinimicrobium sp.]
MKWHAGVAHLPDGVRRNVVIEADGGLFTRVTPDVSVPNEDVVERLPGVVLPGFANAHSHAFHRALRGRTHGGGGTFWTWREAMYAVASRLDPDTYYALAKATYAEMALAGITAVAEFHYLHHGPGGQPYADPNAMSHAVIQAAADAGIRLTLLDTCYLAGGLDDSRHLPPAGAQMRFGDGTVEAWAERVTSLRGHLEGRPEHLRIGAAIHSVRAVPRPALATVGQVAGTLGRAGQDRAGAPLHVHLSEQPAENEACVSAYGMTPTGLLASEGLLSPALTAVHATHLTARDIALLGGAGATACFCPTTERDLADGIGPARALLDAGARLSLGSDQHAVIDLIEEARALEMHERLASGRRGRLGPSDLLTAATAHASIGWPGAGQIRVGAHADLVAVRDDGVRTAGIDPAQIVYAASAEDVDTVVVSGRTVVSDGRHVLGNVAALLREAIQPLLGGH